MYAVFKVQYRALILNTRVGLSGLEPPTSRLSGVRSNQLSYRPIFESYGSLKTEQYFEISDVRPTRS